MRYYLIAGEASGDLHGAYLVRQLHQQDPTANCRCWGGDLMAEAGATLVKHYRELAFMGFWEVVRNLRTILRNLQACQHDIQAFRPDALVLIDYPGFNLRIARWAHQAGIPVYYYISPQIWAWHRSRVHQIKAYVRRMLVILPFEKEFYARYGVDVTFVGHPLLDVVADYQPAPDFRRQNGLDERPIVALLPGSRKQEITRMLPVMAEVATRFPAYQFVVAGAPAQPAALYQSTRLPLVQGQTYELLAHAHAALVTSGTATLETALFGVPQVVCYRGSSLSYAIARRLVDVKYISLVNLIVDQPLVKELIQHQFTADQASHELALLLEGPGRQKITAGYAQLRQLLGEPGAAQRTAAAIISGV